MEFVSYIRCYSFLILREIHWKPWVTIIGLACKKASSGNLTVKGQEKTWHGDTILFLTELVISPLFTSIKDFPSFWKESHEAKKWSSSDWKRIHYHFNIIFPQIQRCNQCMCLSKPATFLTTDPSFRSKSLL